MAKTVRRGVVRVSGHFLAMVLALDGAHEVIQIQQQWQRPGNFELLLEGPRMPELQEGDLVPEVTLVYTRKGREPAELTEIQVGAGGVELPEEVDP